MQLSGDGWTNTTEHANLTRKECSLSRCQARRRKVDGLFLECQKGGSLQYIRRDQGKQGDCYAFSLAPSLGDNSLP